MAKSTALPIVKVPAVTSLPQGSPFVVHVAGADIYSSLRINGKVELEMDDGSKTEATVQSLQVGALIDLLSSTGHQSAMTYGRIYSPLTLVQALTDASEDDVLDVTKLYTAVGVLLAIPPMPALPA